MSLPAVANIVIGSHGALFGDRRRRPLDATPDPSRKRHPFEGPRPLSTRECADYIGQSLDFIYDLIKEETLKAQLLTPPGRKRGFYVIQQADWVSCLKAMKWSRIPTIG